MFVEISYKSSSLPHQFACLNTASGEFLIPEVAHSAPRQEGWTNKVFVKINLHQIWLHIHKKKVREIEWLA